MEYSSAQLFGTVIALLLSGFFVEQAFAQANGTNGGKGADGTKGGIGGSGGIGISGSAINGKNGTSANGHSIGDAVSGSGD
jgi:hypothetical protein